MNIIIDTGAIVALLDENDQYHSFVDHKMRELSPPFYSCEAVITESFFLLQRIPQGVKKLISLLETDKITIHLSYNKYSSNIHEIITKYANLPASFADACLVQIYEITRKAHIFTLDADFNIYRTPGGEPLSLITPQ
jgi:predicted nucleic acid-binding protein